MSDDVSTLLAQVGLETRSLAAGWGSTLNESDRRVMTECFHRAESLAQAALECARDQLDSSYREELTEQIEDEQRHVVLFETWLGPDRATIPTPKIRQRGPAVWFTLLLVNEVCGFCQFNMLAGLVGDREREAAVEAVAADEVQHILRLLRWLEPIREKPAFGEVEKVTGKFRRNLSHRMAQFLPREELAPLRDGMASAVSDLLGRLVYENAPRM